MVAAEAWFNLAPGAQRVNAKLSLGTQDQGGRRPDCLGERTTRTVDTYRRQCE
jgi:hypothetical protein